MCSNILHVPQNGRRTVRQRSHGPMLSWPQSSCRALLCILQLPPTSTYLAFEAISSLVPARPKHMRTFEKWDITKNTCISSICKREFVSARARLRFAMGDCDSLITGNLHMPGVARPCRTVRSPASSLCRLASASKLSASWE